MDRRGWIVAGVLATGLGASGQEESAGPPPPAGVVACVPGHCAHRSILSRRRCKRRLQEAALGFPEEFERAPLGASLYAAMKVQVGNGEAARLVVLDVDFAPGGVRLTARGAERLAEAGATLPRSFEPIVVERTADADLDERRRAAVVVALAGGPLPIPDGRVVVGRPIARGLRGEEALIVDRTNLRRTEAKGPPLNQDAGSTASGATAGRP